MKIGRWLLCLGVLLMLVACSDSGDCPDARIIYVYPEAGGGSDAGPDSAPADAKASDTSAADAPGKDSAKADSAKPDSAKADSAMPDSAMPDSAMPDSAMPDSATPDSTTPDQGASIPMGPGPYSIAYTAKGVGYDYRSPVTATFNSAKQMTGYKYSAKENPTVGTCAVGESYMDKYVALGRWNNGTTAGVFYSNTTGMIHTAKQGFHHVIGAETKSPPTSGSLAYTLTAKTAATMDDGSLSVGAITGKAKINFAATGTKVALELSIVMPGDTTYKLATTGGLADPSKSEISATAGRV